MKSEGKDKGYQCKICKKKTKETKSIIKVERNLKEKLYLPNLSAHRHLTKPMQRIGLEKRGSENRFYSESKFDFLYKYFC